jgi:hypothetical protein
MFCILKQSYPLSINGFNVNEMTLIIRLKIQEQKNVGHKYTIFLPLNHNV